jgi:hypothetical protein
VGVIAYVVLGRRPAEFEDFHRRVGLTKERWYLQQTPEGELNLVTLVGDPAGAIEKLRTSQEPFDVWFRERVKEVHGVDFGQPLPAPPPEPVFEG